MIVNVYKVLCIYSFFLYLQFCPASEGTVADAASKMGSRDGRDGVFCKLPYFGESNGLPCCNILGSPMDFLVTEPIVCCWNIGKCPESKTQKEEP